MTRFNLAAAVVWLLSACSQQDGSAGASNSETPAVKPASKWLFIAHTGQSGGGIYVDPSLIRKDSASGLTDVTLKVSHGDISALDAAAGSAQASLYREEHVTFRFNCAAQTYAVVKREAVNKQGAVLDTTASEITGESFQPVAPGGVASVALGQACPQKPLG